MLRKKQITLAIVTKKRPLQLKRLLDSLVAQSKIPQAVVIVDNDLEFSAKKIVRIYKDCLPIVYFTQKKQGVPFSRNTAYKAATTEYLAFIDDDCILDENWVCNAEKIVSRFTDITYFVGDSEVFNPISNVALAQHINQKYWFLQKLSKEIIASPFNVDTKNIIFKISDFKKFNLNFDSGLSIGWFDNADTDMGFAMQSKGLQGIYVKQLRVWHEEATSLLYFLKKGFYRGKLSRMLAEKWNISDEFVYLPYLNWITYLKSIKGWKEEYKRYFSISKRRSIIAFLYLKFYERCFLAGYASKSN